ncbi:MAG: hypothetical protein B0D92_01390 [Spirochaeta sp. LUC14_002_19_P3]|nr:MAG: hypothetical protein B0D92_01390 [Spirochaeta sp. LUC14_002_19_P3]
MTGNCNRIYITALLIIGVLISCQTAKQPEAVIPEHSMPKEKPVPPQEPELEPFAANWAGTTWIIRDTDNTKTKPFPGYRGFHLGRGGNFFLINSDTAVGGTWSAKGSFLRLEILQGRPELPLSGSFQAFKENEDRPQKIRLVPEHKSLEQGIIFESAAAAIAMEENHWIPKQLSGSEHVLWPASREIHLILLPNGEGGLWAVGYGGENRFRGDVFLDEEQFKTGPLASTKRSGPFLDFETIYLQSISNTTHYIQVDKDVFFYHETKPLTAFRVQMFE